MSEPTPVAAQDQAAENHAAQGHAAGRAKEVNHPLDPVLELARRALANHAKEHRDYTAVLLKRERVGGKLLPETRMEMKLRYDTVETTELVPNSRPRNVAVYLKTIEPKAQAGREVIWVQGANKNKLMAHESGLFGLMTVELAPQSRLAMVGNRYPITEIGIEKLLIKLIERGERDRAMGPATVRKKDGVRMGGVDCNLIEVIHENREIDVDGHVVEFEFHLAQIYIDPERLVPIKYASYMWPNSADAEPELEEEYLYENLQLNVGLTDADFDTKNPAYRFSK